MVFSIRALGGFPDMVVVRSNVRREGGYATPAASRQEWHRKSVRVQAEGGPRAVAARRCLESGAAAISARGRSRRRAIVSVGAVAMTPAEHDRLHFAPWLEWPHSIVKELPSGTALDTAADLAELVAERSKCAPGATIKDIARRTLKNRFTLATNMTTC